MTREEAILYGEEYLNDLMATSCDISKKHKEFVNMAIKALEQEMNCSEIPKGSTTKNDLGVDCISRKAVLNKIFKFGATYRRGFSVTDLWKEVNELPPVTPKPKTGHWIDTGHYFMGAYSDLVYYKCSCCHEDSLEDGDFCPNCGAKMVEPQEREE